MKLKISLKDDQVQLVHIWSKQTESLHGLFPTLQTEEESKREENKQLRNKASQPKREAEERPMMIVKPLETMLYICHLSEGPKEGFGKMKLIKNKMHLKIFRKKCMQRWTGLRLI